MGLDLKWSSSKLLIVEASGHSAMEPKITSELTNAPEEMKNLLKGNWHHVKEVKQEKLIAISILKLVGCSIAPQDQ